MIFENRFVNVNEATKYFSAATAVVLPYKSATQSGVLSMAYHYTVPLIVTNHPGISKPVKNDETVIVCAPSTSAVAEAIKKLDSSQEIEKFKKNMEDSKTTIVGKIIQKNGSHLPQKNKGRTSLIKDVIITNHELMIHIINDHLFQLSRTPSMISTKIMHWNVEMIASI